jgi:hypothetical protein
LWACAWHATVLTTASCFLFLVLRLAGGHEPSQLDSAFTNSLGTMFDVIEDADVQSQEQEKLLINMNSLMDVQQVIYLGGGTQKEGIENKCWNKLCVFLSATSACVNVKV